MSSVIASTGWGFRMIEGGGPSSRVEGSRQYIFAKFCIRASALLWMLNTQQTISLTDATFVPSFWLFSSGHFGTSEFDTHWLTHLVIIRYS